MTNQTKKGNLADAVTGQKWVMPTFEEMENLLTQSLCEDLRLWIDRFSKPQETIRGVPSSLPRRELRTQPDRRRPISRES